VGLPGLVLRLDPDATPCFKRRRLNNGEPTWRAVEPAFCNMMQQAADRVRLFLSGPAPEGLQRKYISAADSSDEERPSSSSSSARL